MSGTTTRLVVLVERILPVNEIHKLDRDLPQQVIVHINNSVPNDRLADTALDIFHASFAIKVLDDFDIRVLLDGIDLEPSADHENGSLEHRGSIE